MFVMISFSLILFALLLELWAWNAIKKIRQGKYDQLGSFGLALLDTTRYSLLGRESRSVAILTDRRKTKDSQVSLSKSDGCNEESE